MISPNSFVQYVKSPSKHAFIGFAAVTPLEPLPLAGIGLFRFSTNPRRTDGVDVALVPLGDFVPGAFGGARVVFRPRVVPELLLGRDEVELVTLLLEVVRVKFKSELLSSDIVAPCLNR